SLQVPSGPSLLPLLLRRNCSHAEAQVEVLQARRGGVAVGRPAAPAAVVPAPAPDHPVRATRRPRWVARRAVLVVVLAVPVGTPLPDVAMHVPKPERIGRVRPHL